MPTDTTSHHEIYMQAALAQAGAAAQLQEVPIGAIIIDETGSVIGQAHNRVEQYHTQTAHAEALAISQAGQTRGDWRLIDSWIYVTITPSSICVQTLPISR